MKFTFKKSTLYTNHNIKFGRFIERKAITQIATATTVAIFVLALTSQPGSAAGNNVGVNRAAAGIGSINFDTGANNGITLAGDTSIGILAIGQGGPISITTGSGSDITVNDGDGTGGGLFPATQGIRAIATTGAITINLGGSVTANGIDRVVSPTEGIFASTIGAININSTGVGTAITSEFGDAIHVIGGTGPINIGGAGGIAAAINATGEGQLPALGDGINVSSTGGAVTVRTAVTGDIAGTAFDGMNIDAAGPVTVETFGTIGSRADAVGRRGIYVHTSVPGSGDLNITVHDKIWSTGRGILADGWYNDVNITTTRGADIVSLERDGIKATTFATNGNVFLNLGASASGAENGVVAFTFKTGNVSISMNDPLGSITGMTGSGIAVSTELGTVTINNNTTGFIQGAGGEGNAAIRLMRGGNVNITNSGTIQAIGGSPSALAISANEDPVGIITIRNNRTINGRFNFASAAGFNFINNSSLTWNVSGMNIFSAGDDVLNNAANGTINTSGTTIFDFLGGSDNFANAGTLNANGSVMFAGLETLSNAGVIRLQSNSQTKGSFVLSGNYVGGGIFGIDAVLGGTDQTPAQCGTASAVAGCIVINGTVSGATALQVNDIGGPYGQVLNGMAVVYAPGATAANTFFLAGANVDVTNNGPVIHKDLWDYALAYDPAAKSLNIFSVPNLAAFRLSKVSAGLQTAWYETAHPWLDRTADLREIYAGGNTGNSSSSFGSEGGVWGRVFYSSYDRDSIETFTPPLGSPFTYSVGYNQNVGGIQMGADIVQAMGDDATLLFGLMGGYTSSQMDFAGSSGDVDLKGGNVGGYVTYLNHQIFIDALIKADFMNAESDFGAVDTDAKTYGGSIEAGYTYQIPDSCMRIEPMATLSYTKTDLDDYTVGITRVHSPNATSFRGRLSMRVTGDIGDSKLDMQFRPFAIIGVEREWRGDNGTDLLTPSGMRSIVDHAVGTYGIGSFGLDVFDNSGISGFIMGDFLFGNSDLSGGGFRIGIRWSFGGTTH